MLAEGRGLLAISSSTISTTTRGFRDHISPRELQGDRMMAEDPVWITGVGLATSLGCNLATLEASLLAGRSGIAVVTSFCTTDYPSRIAAELPAVPCPSGREPREFHALSRLEQAALWCVQAALEDAGLWDCRATRRIG